MYSGIRVRILTRSKDFEIAKILRENNFLDEDRDFHGTLYNPKSGKKIDFKITRYIFLLN